MSNSNDFTPFATASGANVLSPAAWAADAAHAVGFQAGILPGVKLNTPIRQAMFVAAMIAQFTADLGPGNVLDNGNLSAFEAQFEAALKALIAGGGSPFAIGLQNVRLFTTIGTTAYTPTNAAVRALLIQQQAPGAGGGSTSAPSTGQASIGLSGSGGAFAQKYVLTSALTFPANLTLGALGAAGGSGSAGGNGGTSSFVCTGMASLICTGGNGGAHGGISSTFPGVGAGNSGGSASGGDINISGGPAQSPIILSASQIATGQSGGSVFGTPALQIGVAGNGGPGTGFGSGGGGGCAPGPSGAFNGAAGSPPITIITELF